MTVTSDYRVQLQAYAGPLDLLLYLVKRNEIDLHDIPIASLTDQYLQHLEVIKTIDVDRAGEFLVMAATLLEIKSRLIVPPPEVPEEDEQGEGAELAGATGDNSGASGGDPRFELVQQLLAYRRYKGAAIELELRHDQWMQRFAAAATKPMAEQNNDPAEAEILELDLEDIHVMDLCEAFGRLLDSIGNVSQHEVTYDDTPISLHAADICDRLEREGPMTLQQIFAGRDNRSEMIGLFLAMLELVRDRLVAVIQDQVASEIRLERLPPEVSDIADSDPKSQARAVALKDSDYDWPDPEAREQAKQRARRRAERFARIRAGEMVEDEGEDDHAIELDNMSVDAMLEQMEVAKKPELDSTRDEGQVSPPVEP